MKRCPKCMNITDSRFCPECGHDMSTIEALICPKCGNETTSRFCSNCGTKVLDSSEPIEIRDSDEAPAKEQETIPVTDNEYDSAPGIGNSDSIIAAKKENNNFQKKIRDVIAKKPIAAGAVILVLVLVLLAAISPDKKAEDTSADINANSQSTVEENSQEYDSVDDSDDSGSTTYSDTDDGLDRIQGYWELVGVVTDGESTNVSGLSVGSLVINGDRWTMTISTDETTENSGTLYFDMKSDLDSGEPFYVYTMRSDGMSGSVKMAYSAENDFIAVSTNTTLDSNNCLMFGR